MSSLAGLTSKMTLKETKQQTCLYLQNNYLPVIIQNQSVTSSPGFYSSPVCTGYWMNKGMLPWNRTRREIKPATKEKRGHFLCLIGMQTKIFHKNSFITGLYWPNVMHIFHSWKLRKLIWMRLVYQT